MAADDVEHTTFAQALAQTSARPRHLLLGNGFSIGAHPAFGYPNLFEEASGQDPGLRDLFPPDDTNFEHALQQCSGEEARDRVRRGLIRAVAAVHPENSLHLTEEQCLSCRDFLEHFVGRRRTPRGCVFTTNYDLLLHWVISRQGKNRGTKQVSQLKCWDGFDGRGEWNVGSSPDVTYLHGAVHLFEFPQHLFPDRLYTQMLRYRWGNTLRQQVDRELKRGRFPIFIAEATSADKRAKLRGEYLAKGWKRFKNVNGDAQSALFTFGHSFGSSDEHLSLAIANGTVSDVFVGAFSDLDRQRASELATEWASVRSATGGPPVRVHSYDAASCNVWDGRSAVAA